jgi:hypothetical protein
MELRVRVQPMPAANPPGIFVWRSVKSFNDRSQDNYSLGSEISVESPTFISDAEWVAFGLLAGCDLASLLASLVRASPSKHSESHAIFFGIPDRAGGSRACFAAAAGLTPYQPARPRTTHHLPYPATTDRSCIPGWNDYDLHLHCRSAWDYGMGRCSCTSCGPVGRRWFAAGADRSIYHCGLLEC